MERTTITFDSELLKRLREEAARQEKNLSTLVNELVSGELGRRRKPAGYRLKWSVEQGRRAPPVDPADRDQLYDYLNEKSR